MSERIGETAGKVWQFLSERGEVTTARLIREIGGPRDLVNRAMGWLAKEDKIVFENDTGAEKVHLK
jgi:hypothetical protein